MVFATWFLVNQLETNLLVVKMSFGTRKLADQLITSSQLIIQAEDGPDGTSIVVTGLKGIKMVFGSVICLTRYLPALNQLSVGHTSSRYCSFFTS